MEGWLEKIALSGRSRTPVILQTESAECGLACIAMVASHYGHWTDLPSLRQQFQISAKGATLQHLMDHAASLKLGCRPLRLELNELDKLKLPCILHWNFNHFVVLQSVGRKTITIHDPATGRRNLAFEEASSAFTGIALELWPETGFSHRRAQPQIQFRSLVGKVSGLWGAFGQILLLAAVLEVFSIVNPFFFQWVIDHVLVSADIDLLTTLALGFGLLMIVRELVTVCRSWIILHMATTLSLQWRANVFNHLLRLPIQYFEKRHMGDVVSRFGSVDEIQRTLTTSFLEAILDGFMSVLILIVMFIYSPVLASVALVALLLYSIGRWVWYAPFRNANQELIVHAAKQQSHFLESVRGVKAIKLFQRIDSRKSSWLSLLVNEINAGVRTQKYLIFYNLLNGLLFGIEHILIIWWGANLVLDGGFSVGMLIAFYSYKQQFGSRSTALIDKFFQLKMLQLQGERLADIVLTEPELRANAGSENLPENIQPSVEITDLSFQYGDREPLILDKLNLSIKAGESVAIVGASGCGKTTLLKILLGIFPVSRGKVLVGGIEVNQRNINSFRAITGTVLQDDELFSGSLRENISMFDPEVDSSWVEHCARLASVHSEIEAMPMKYNTLIGDMGTVLSGGQKQRVLLARALYKKPRLLVLDESTSHLDLYREQQINQAMRTLSITRIIVSHRPETVASVDRILVLNNGNIAHEQRNTRSDLRMVRPF